MCLSFLPRRSTGEPAVVRISGDYRHGSGRRRLKSLIDVALAGVTRLRIDDRGGHYLFQVADTSVCMSGSEDPPSRGPASPESTSLDTGRPERTPSDPEIPPLDVVDSRWWYWIVAYPVVALLIIPAILVLGGVALAPFFAISPDPQPAVGVVVGLLGIAIALLLLVTLLASLAVFVVFPVALYMDARVVSKADYEWKPDPVVYGLLGVLQFVVTPLIGLLVALYYLFRRHEHLGVP